MAARLEVHFSDLTRGIAGHGEAADRARTIRGARSGARLPHGALGKLPQSDEIKQAFDDAYDGAGEALTDLAKALDGVADRIEMTRDELGDLDALVAELFTRLASSS